MFKTIKGLEKVASEEILEKLNLAKLVFSPYGPHGWLRCEVKDSSFPDVRRLRSISEAYMLLHDETYTERFSIDHFADATVEAIPSYAPHARRISVSAYSTNKKFSQRVIQGAFSKRIREKLNAECSLKDCDTILRINLLRKAVIAAIDLHIRPGNIQKKLETHPTALLPPIAYCMIRLSSPQGDEQLLDPMCGCGTIPIMAALEWRELKIAGSDVSGDYVSCASRNAEAMGVADKVRFFVSDIADLPSKGIEADMIAVNPPYGIARPVQTELKKFYDSIFEVAHRVLSSKGRIAIVTPYPEIIEKAASKFTFRVGSVYKISEGELPRTIHIIEKSS
ncbi:MAG: methyltransferase [Candidatus Atabeyarchaeum deiterrae]